LIESGGVVVAGVAQPRAASLVSPATAIELAGPAPRFVSRGGLKLDAALDAFPVPVASRRVLDAGASTGGFTDCLLQRGAASVTAVDVGYGQLDPRVRADPRVVVRDRTNLRHLTPEEAGGTFDLVVGDLSFISLCTVAPALARLASPGADLILLVKPQFEVGRGEVGRGGLVRAPDRRRWAVERVVACLDAQGLGAQGVIASPITGAKGNREYLLWARQGARAVEGLEVPE
jgi:23S rRNA (cytidine1920-2'-O)/16S rRNA (cytidine1409-2'-O)-methyltransferase